MGSQQRRRGVNQCIRLQEYRLILLTGIIQQGKHENSKLPGRTKRWMGRGTECPEIYKLRSSCAIVIRILEQLVDILCAFVFDAFRLLVSKSSPVTKSNNSSLKSLSFLT